jgi:hypothetical protein
VKKVIVQNSLENPEHRSSISDMHPIPYLGFNGSCAEAMRFYASVHTLDRQW